MPELKTIMLVDDDEDITLALKNLLEDTQKFKVVFTNLGAEALALAKRTKPDLIVCDIDMPDMEGGEVAFVLSGSDQTKEIPILFLSSLVTKQDLRETGKFIGNHPMIPKSVSTHVLIDEIIKMVN